MIISSYLEHYNTQIEMMEAYGGTVCYNEVMVQTQLSLMKIPLDFTTANTDKVNEAT